MSDTLRVILAIPWLVIGILCASGVLKSTPKIIAALACFNIMHVLLFS